MLLKRENPCKYTLFYFYRQNHNFVLFVCFWFYRQANDIFFFYKIFILNLIYNYMIGITEKENTLTQNHDFELGIPGFHYSDLYDAVRLRELADKFYAEIEEEDPLLHEALTTTSKHEAKITNRVSNRKF